MTRRIRKSLKSGVCSPVESFDEDVRRQFKRHSIGVISTQTALQDLENQQRFPAILRLACKEIPANHFTLISEF